MFTLGIAGGSGSGKTTMVDRLRQLDVAEYISFVPHDAYYRNRAAMPETVRTTENWDHPDALDTDLFLEHIQQLKSGTPILRPVYDFATHSRSAETVEVGVQPVLVLEGLLLFHDARIRQEIDLKVYVETPSDLRILSRVMRDVSERGRTVESIAHQYQTTVRPMHSIFVEPSKGFADVVIPWEWHNEKAVALLAARIREHGPGFDVS